MPIAVSAETVRLDVEVKDYDGNPLPGVTKDNVDWGLEFIVSVRN